MANNINKLGFYVTGYNYTRQEELAAQSAPEQKGKQTEKENKQVSREVIDGYNNQAGNYGVAAFKMQQAQRYQALIDKANADTTEESRARLTNLMTNFTAENDLYEEIGAEIGLSDSQSRALFLQSKEKQLNEI